MMFIGDVTAGVAATLPMFSPLDADKIKSVRLLNNAALAGDAVNNVQLALRKKGGNDMATYLNDVASGGLVQREGKAMTLAALEADQKMVDGDNLELAITHNGTGQALTGAVLQIELVA